MKYLHDKNRFATLEKPSLIERLLVKLFRVRVIYKAGQTYLRRFYLTPRWKWLPFKIFLHHIMMSDSRDANHDHPWPFKSLMIKGSYLEFIQANSFKNTKDRTVIVVHRLVEAGDFINNGPNHIHHVEIVKPVWTLVIAGRAMKVWGFHTVDRGWVPWREYLGTPDAVDYNEDQI